MRAAQTLFATVMLSIGLQTATAAQETADSARFSDKVNVNEVLLDVLVTDQDGHVIVGLDKDDFVVEEKNGVVPLTGSTFYSNRELVGAAASDSSELAPALVSEDRYFIIFLHDQRLAVPQLTRKYLELARSAEDWIRTELLPNDWVAVVRYDVKLRIHADFTRDNEKLVNAVRDAARGKSPRDTWPSRTDTEASAAPSLLASLPEGKELRRQTTRLYSGLELLAEAAGKVVGRKNLLFFSGGFGEDTGFGTIRPDPRYYDDTMEALNDNNLAVYSISVLTGLDFAGLARAQSRSQNSMNVLANDTGGRYFYNHVNFAAPLEQVLAENSGYYLLSYTSETPAGESGYRQVAVTAKNPEFRVRAREGYKFGA